MLILTDGEIHDMARTKSLLVDLSYLACSVIIIGVGSEDFTNMHVLDGDTILLSDETGRKVLHDLVQFVEFNKAIEKGDLAEQVLAELPIQFMSFM